MPRIVLLARPHPIIISEMRPFLELAGFAPKRLDSLTMFKSSNESISGAIISLAVLSSIEDTAEAVFSGIRKYAPRLPILFAAMLDFSAMKGALRRIAKLNNIEATILGVDPSNDNHPDLGKPNTLVYLSMGDLTTPIRSVLASKIVQRHFR